MGHLTRVQRNGAVQIKLSILESKSFRNDIREDINCRCPANAVLGKWKSPEQVSIEMQLICGNLRESGGISAEKFRAFNHVANLINCNVITMK